MTIDWRNHSGTQRESMLPTGMLKRYLYLVGEAQRKKQTARQIITLNETVVINKGKPQGYFCSQSTGRKQLQKRMLVVVALYRW